MANNNKSDVLFSIYLDENQVPEKLVWSAEEGGISKEEAKAFFISVWDDKKKETLKMDLWTKDMPLDEMKHFFYQTFLSMADTFHRATTDDKMTASMRDFADYFAEKLELIEKEKE